MIGYQSIAPPNLNEGPIGRAHGPVRVRCSCED